MLFPSNNFSNIIVYNSITNNLNDQKYDSIQPFTFVDYLNYSKSLNKNVINFSDYQTYLSNWNTATNNSNDNLSSQVSQQFVAFLQSITLNFSTAEEKRYLSNINFYDPNDLEIAIPFYVNKIKQVLLYFANKRDTFKIDLQLAKNNGTVNGVESYLRTYIVETLLGQDNPPFNNLATPLTAISNKIQIEVEEGYDTFNDYFDLDPFQPPSFYVASGDRAQYFQANTNLNDNNIFLDYNQAIINLINSEQVALQALQNLVININTPDPTLLQPYDFTDYNSTLSDNILLTNNKQLIENYSGTDTYYLSTNAAGQILSGNMFTATDPYANLLNVYNPSTLTVPSDTTVYEREAGLFYKPTARSIIQLQTPFEYYVKHNLPTDTTFTFPDPNSYGNISGVSKEDHATPLNFVLQGEKIQKNISSNNAFGNTNVSKNDFTFESYYSLEQQETILNYAKSLYNSGVVTQYITDVYGNAFIGFKQANPGYINTVSKTLMLNSVENGLSANATNLYTNSIEVLSTGTFANTQSVFTSTPLTGTAYTIYDRRNSPGNYYVFNIANLTLNPLQTELSNVLAKYNSYIQNDITNNLISLDVYNDTFVFTTSSYMVVDKVLYNEGNFSQSNSLPLILGRDKNSTITNPFLVDNNLYFGKYFINPDINMDSNLRLFVLNLYVYNINNNTYTTNTNSGELTFTYDGRSKIDSYTAVLSYNSKFDIFNMAINIKDGLQNFFLHTIQFRYAANQVTIATDKVFMPDNTYYTINFFDNSNTFDLLTYPIATTPYITNSNGTITF